MIDTKTATDAVDESRRAKARCEAALKTISNETADDIIQWILRTILSDFIEAMVANGLSEEKAFEIAQLALKTGKWPISLAGAVKLDGPL